MIVHVYNPERIVSKTNNSKVVVPPPPSPKLLRHSSFKGFQTRGAAAAESPPCLLNKRLRDKEEATAMDSSSDGLWSNLPPTAASQPSQMACTCHCSSSNSQETSGHYFTPVSSFTMDDSKEPDSLEYKNELTSVRESPPMRKASLDRILSSPQVQRRPVYFSSPHSSGGAAAAASSPGDKSPVAAAVPLSTSMSNASIHSNYSEDSLTATPAGQRWNKYGQWIADSGSCMEQRPPAAINSSSLDFSKDSLNTSSAVQEPEEEEEEEEESESCSSSVKLEPLAFTIDFGDVTPVHKKKETPKRLAERLTSARHSSTTTKSTCEQQQQSTSESKNAKMLKSLSSRLGGGGHQLPLMESSSVPHNSRRSATPNSKGESSSSSRNSSVNRASQNNNNNGNSVAQQQQQRKSSKVGLKQRTPSPTPPSSPVKSGRPPPPPPALGSNSSRNRRKLQQQQSDPEGIEDEEEIVLVDNEVEGANDAAEEEEQQQTENNDDDTASETGTYTIGKDSPSPDEDQSRRDIDRVFGLVVSAASIPLDSSNSSGNHPQWVSDWAAQVVQQQEAAAMLPSGVSVKPPSHPQHRPPPPELPTTARPRRKLPSLPPVSTPRSRSSTRPSPAEMSDPSDSSLETESFLRDTESVVSAMQARMDGRSSTESDVETRSSSTSYRPTSAQLPGGDIENSIGRKLSAQLRAKIRSLDESYQQSTASATTNTPSGNVRKGSYVISSSTSGSTAVTQAGVNNVIHNELHGSGGEDAKSLHSDSSLSDITSGETSSRSRHHEDHKAAGQNAPTVRYNRALSLRRGRLGLDGDQTNVSNPSGGGGGGSPSRGSSPQVPAPSARKLSSASGQSQASSRAGSTASASSFSRNDGGRFSLRVGSNKTSSSTTPTVKPKVCKNPIQQQQQPVNLPPMGGPRKSRSNSTLSSKEAEFQNWKRRKNYDPMKAAAEGKKKEAARRSTTLTMSQSMIGPVASSISPSSQSPSPPPRTIIRSASFTCVNSPKSRSGLDRSSEIQQEMEMKYSNGNRRTSYRKPSSMFYSSEDETETMYNSHSPSKKAISKTGSSAASTRAHYLGLNLMPSSSSSSTHLQYRHHNSSPPSLPADFSDLASITSNDIDLNSSPGSPRRKHYMEDGLLMRTSASNSSLRARTKLEALDNLVISTIHGLSSKIRGNAEGLLRKLRPQYLDDLERLGLIDDTLNRLADCVTESPIHAVTGGRSSSRELSGTLKVMKRVEQVFQALDQVLFEEVLEGGGEEGAILNDGGTTTEGEDWNGGYTSGDFY